MKSAWKGGAIFSYPPSFLLPSSSRILLPLMASSSLDTTIPVNTLLHLLTIKLQSTNYLLWENQMLPILSYQNLLGHVDGTCITPAATISDNPVENPAWIAADQKTIIIIHASLSEEAISVIVGLPTARQIWIALEAAYGNSSIERVHTLRDQLRLIVKGSKSVAEYGRAFKSLCDQLSAIGHRVDANDQLHWTTSHYANACPKLSSFASQTAPNSDDLATSFDAHCHVNTSRPDWYVDSGATDHMTTSTETVSNPSLSAGSDNKTGTGPRNM
ncbi:hypothetical protein L1987_21912 [Smallanthus sonchifolius]|uniref:Uncharacterized protein n=1 Tax=Smallanthus sonchifolius TaxID=185202 RepID=A0ACB9IG19_9ASTR|nr:hypothetical protein L1987_21912 [Smallanthus sonchifolius]